LTLVDTLALALAPRNTFTSLGQLQPTQTNHFLLAKIHTLLDPTKAKKASIHKLPKQMANTQLSHHIFRPISAVHVSSTKPTTRLPLQFFKNKSLALKADQNSKWAIGLSLVDQSPPKSTVDTERLVGFLYDDLPHLFDDQGIDRTAYDEVVKFRDPITKHDTISGYLFNIALLKTLFKPNFQLHWVKQVCFTMISVIVYVTKKS
jgi:hypothetical protein